MTDEITRIMLVDDSESDNYFHKIVIQDTGKNVEVEDCVEATDALKRITEAVAGERPMPDLILLDINMPALDGWQFLDAYSDIVPPHYTTPVVVMLSNSANPSDKARADSVPIVRGYCAKPLTPDDIEYLLREHLTKPD